LLKTPALTPKLVLTALVILLAVAVSCLPVPTASIWRLLKLTVPLPALVPISSVVVPVSGPVPAESVTVTFRLAGKLAVELFPNWSWLLSTG